jgi:hypothetical protein
MPREKIDQPNIFPDVTNEDEITSADNLLPERNKEIGIQGDNPVETATDIPGSTKRVEAGRAGGGGSGPGPKA